MQGLTTLNPEHPGTLSFPTDTQTPHPIVPVFLIHTREQPFCSQPSCACHHNHVAVTTLLAAVDQGAVSLRETADFLVPCQQNMTADHHPGEEATQVHVAVSETYTGVVYQLQARMPSPNSETARPWLVRSSHRQLSKTVTNLHSQSRSREGGVSVSSGRATAYHHADRRQREGPALTLLEHIPGVQAVSLTIKNDAATLPEDASSIHLVLLITG